MEHCIYCVQRPSYKPPYWEGRNSILNDWSFDQMARTLYIGYEVEETPEDKIKTYYEDLKFGRDRTDLPLETCRGFSCVNPLDFDVE